jgi:hypothetical protein
VISGIPGERMEAETNANNSGQPPPPAPLPSAPVLGRVPIPLKAGKETQVERKPSYASIVTKSLKEKTNTQISQPFCQDSFRPLTSTTNDDDETMRNSAMEYTTWYSDMFMADCRDKIASLKEAIREAKREKNYTREETSRCYNMNIN